MIPLARLGEVLEHRKEFVTIDDLQTYKRSRVRLHAQGIVLRDEVRGAEIRTKQQQVCRTGEFLVAEIDAKVGGFGIVPLELDGAIVSSHYFLYVVNEDRLDRRYLDWFARTPAFREQVEAQGSTNYAAIRPRDVLEYQLPLPPLTEQRRIVARIEELGKKTSEARALRQQALEQAEHLTICMAQRRDMTEAARRADGWRQIPLSECLRLTDDCHRVEASKSYPNLGIFSFGRGLFEKPPIEGALTAARTLRRVRQGQFIYSRLFAFEGAYSGVPPEFGGYFVSNEYPTFDCDPDLVRIELLAGYFKSPEVWQQIAAGSKGLGHRRQRVQPTRLLEHLIWLPPMRWQERIAQVEERLDAVKGEQAKTQAELDALLPSVLDKAFKGEL